MCSLKLDHWKMFSSFSQRVSANLGSSVTLSYPEDVLDDDYPYRTNLMFSELTVNDVGFYYCIFKDVHARANSVEEKEHYDDEVKNGDASSIYVFVNGKVCVTFNFLVV